MQYKNKEISSLDQSELLLAHSEMTAMRDNYLKKLEHPRLKKLKPPPEMNPIFVSLLDEIKAEIEKRKENAK